VVNLICFIILLLSMGCGLIRLIKGPFILDRLIAFDAIAISSIGVVVLVSAEFKTPYFLDIILIFCLLGFVSTVALMDYLFRTQK
jgi:multicomponent Na+:H+ antiporter subunit F